MARDPVLITGIADFLQIYMTHAINPVSHKIIFHLKLVNVTEFELKNVTVNISFSESVKTKTLEAKQKRIASISTKSAKEFSLVASID